MYTIKGTENFAVFDSPGDTENYKNLQFFSKKGYIYSKVGQMLIEMSSLLKNSIVNVVKVARWLKWKLLGYNLHLGFDPH